ALAIGHFVFGGLVALAITVNYTVMPLVSTYTYTDQTTSLSYGWEEVIPVLDKVRAERDIGFIATPWYASAGALAFALGDPAVTSLYPGRDAFDDWFDPAAHRGENALIVADRKRGLTDEIRALFRSVRRLERVDVVRHGFVIERYSIYLARGYAPGPWRRLPRDAPGNYSAAISHVVLIAADLFLYAVTVPVAAGDDLVARGSACAASL